MLATIKRWLPFFIMLILALAALINLVLFTEDSYKPQNADPDIIYYEACSECHGDTGQGSILLYPALDSLSSRREIEKIIVNGGWLMPKFKHIHGDTLKKLVNYIYERKYLEK